MYIITIILLALYATIQLHYCNAGITAISFGAKFDCSVQATYLDPNVTIIKAPRMCIAMTALLTLSKDEPTFNRTIYSYVDNDGHLVTLNYTIGLEATLSNTTIELPMKYDSTVFNVYEEFDAGEACAIGVNVGKCFDSLNRPPMTGTGEESYVACCINKDTRNATISAKSRRRTGAWCLKYDYAQAYERYKFTVNNAIYNTHATLKITMKGQTRVFNMDMFTGSSEVKDFGKVTTTFDTNNMMLNMQDITYLYEVYRDATPTSSSMAEIDRWYYTRPLQKLSLSPIAFKSMVQCAQEEQFTTRTHFNIDNGNDQFYQVKQQKLKTLVSTWADPNSMTATKLALPGTTSSGNSVMYNIKGTTSPLTAIISMTIYDVN